MRTYYKARLSFASSSRPSEPTRRTHDETLTAASLPELIEQVKEYTPIPKRPSTIYRDTTNGDAEPVGFICHSWQQKCDRDDWNGKYWQECWVEITVVEERAVIGELPVKLEVL